MYNYNTRAESTQPVSTTQPITWHAWLAQVARAIAESSPDDPKVQFVANLVKDAATVAAIHAIPDYLAHYRWLMETGVEEYPTTQDGPAAPILPGCIAGHPAQWEIPTTEDDGDILPW
jgi:hypothetical protein